MRRKSVRRLLKLGGVWAIILVMAVNPAMACRFWGMWGGPLFGCWRSSAVYCGGYEPIYSSYCVPVDCGNVGVSAEWAPSYDYGAEPPYPAEVPPPPTTTERPIGPPELDPMPSQPPSAEPPAAAEPPAMEEPPLTVPDQPAQPPTTPPDNEFELDGDLFGPLPETTPPPTTRPDAAAPIPPAGQPPAGDTPPATDPLEGLFDEGPAAPPANEPAAPAQPAEPPALDPGLFGPPAEGGADDLDLFGGGNAPAEEPAAAPPAGEAQPPADAQPPGDDLFPPADSNQPLDDLNDLFGQAPAAERRSESARPTRAAARSTPSVSVSMRTWVDNTGYYRTRARLVEVGRNYVRLLKDNGRYTTVPMTRLSDGDFEYVRQVVQAYSPSLDGQLNGTTPVATHPGSPR